MFNYWCSNRNKREGCEFCDNKTGDLQLDDRGDDFVCPNDKSIELKLLGESTSLGIITGKHKFGRTSEEKKKRNIEHFKKEIYPTIGGKEKEYFRKKHGIKK